MSTVSANTFANWFIEKMSPSSREGRNLGLSNEFRAIKRTLLKTAFSDPDVLRNRIMVTSLRPGAGRSFVAYNAARSIALEQDKTVLLVNTDVMSDEIDRAISKSEDDATVGLIDLLVTPGLPVSDVIYSTEISNFKVIPRGRENYLANELFSSALMNKLMQEFQDRYKDRLVIFDAPPLLEVSEAATLSQFVDQVVIVLEHNKTKISDIKKVQDLIPNGVEVHYLLNKVI